MYKVFKQHNTLIDKVNTYTCRCTQSSSQPGPSTHCEPNSTPLNAQPTKLVVTDSQYPDSPDTHSDQNIQSHASGQDSQQARIAKSTINNK